MFGQLPYKTKQFFFLLIKLSIVVGAFYFIYQKLNTNENLDFAVFVQYLNENHVFSTRNIIFLLLLSSLNWCLEVLKWQNLVSVVKRISFWESTEQCLGSLTASLFTPNRIGEYGVKAMYYSNNQRKRILLLNLLSNMSQLLVTVIVGCIGFTLFYLQYDTNITLKKVARFVIVLLSIGLFTFFGVKKSRFSYRGFSLEKIRNYIKDMPRGVHVKTVVLSILRYAVFSFQFYFLLKIFGVDVYYFNAMLVIASMYLLSSIIPSIFIFDVIVKGSVALFLFDIVGVNSLTVLSIVTLMWILNFVIPSIFGSIYVLRFKYDSINNEHQ